MMETKSTIIEHQNKGNTLGFKAKTVNDINAQKAVARWILSMKQELYNWSPIDMQGTWCNHQITQIHHSNLSPQFHCDMLAWHSDYVFTGLQTGFYITITAECPLTKSVTELPSYRIYFLPVCLIGRDSWGCDTTGGSPPIRSGDDTPGFNWLSTRCSALPPWPARDA